MSSRKKAKGKARKAAKEAKAKEKEKEEGAAAKKEQQESPEAQILELEWLTIDNSPRESNSATECRHGFEKVEQRHDACLCCEFVLALNDVSNANINSGEYHLDKLFNAGFDATREK